MGEERCNWCGEAVGRSFVELPRRWYDQDPRLYCSAACLTAERAEMFGRSRDSSSEKWLRFCAEVPPELAAMLDGAQRRALGVNWDGYKDRPTNATRASIVRAALRMYLDTMAPIPELPVEGTAEDVIEVRELERGPS